ncbi:replication initiator [Actinomycetes bacterium KLBMP 9759]
MTTTTDRPALDLLSARLRSPDYPAWRAQVEATGGCAQPVRLTGSSTICDRDGAILIERAGEILAPCGNRRASVCPACSDRYAADAFHLIRAGLAGNTKGVPATVTEKPRAFLTLTAPSFGQIHTRRTTAAGRAIPCACKAWHHPDDPRIGSPVDPESYDYEGAILWQAHAGELWHRFTINLRRALASHLGIPARLFPQWARLSYAKVAEYQRRGLVHFHAVLRVDGPGGPADRTPRAITPDLLRDAVQIAARAVRITVDRPDGTVLELHWGDQLDLRHITPTAAQDVEEPGGRISDAKLAGYVAKYATKGTSASETADRPIRDVAHVEHLDVTPHHRRMIETAWQLGEHPAYEHLGLRRWAHMLGFRGHFLTKSQRYSTTFTAIRDERRTWRLRELLTQLDRDTDDPNTIPIDLDTITVVNDWRLVHIGHTNHAERELALAIAERNRQHRSSLRTSGGTS